MYLYWQVDRKATICTLTNDFNPESGFLKWLPCSFRYHSFATSPSEERACGCPHDPLILIWKSSLLQVFLASQFQKGLELSHLRVLFLKCGPFLMVLQLSTVTYIFIHFVGWVSLHWWNSFHGKEIFPQDALGHHLATTGGSDYLLPSRWSSTVVRTADMPKRAGVPLQSNCQSPTRGSSFSRLKFKQNAYMYPFFWHITVP